MVVATYTFLRWADVAFVFSKVSDLDFGGTCAKDFEDIEENYMLSSSCSSTLYNLYQYHPTPTKIQIICIVIELYVALFVFCSINLH